MKKILLTLVFVTGVTILNLQAQKGKEVVFGVGGAITSTWIMNQSFYGEPEVDYAPKMGGAGSFNLGYNFDPHITVCTEIQFSLQGQKYDGKQNINGTVYKLERNINLNYLNIPLLFKYSFGTGNTKFRFLAGPQIGILVNATQDYKRDGIKQGTKVYDLNGIDFITDEDNIKDRYEKTDFSLVLDFGADIHLSDQFFVSAGLRGNYGLTEINAAPYRIPNLDGDYTASHNAWGGLYVSINYKLDVQGYSQRSF